MPGEGSNTCLPVHNLAFWARLVETSQNLPPAGLVIARDYTKLYPYLCKCLHRLAKSCRGLCGVGHGLSASSHCLAQAGLDFYWEAFEAVTDDPRCTWIFGFHLQVLSQEISGLFRRTARQNLNNINNIRT